MKILIRGIIYSLILTALAAGSSYACGCDSGGLWLSTDPNHFAAGGVGYVTNSSNDWEYKSYCTENLPFTMYLYNETSSCYGGTAKDIGLIVAVHKGETNGSITIADAFGVETTLHYSDFSTYDPYPGYDHGVYDNDGVFAVLKPSTRIDLTTDYTNHENTTSTSSSWTDFVVKSSSFSEVHFDAKSTGWCGDTLYTGSCNDVTLCGPGGFGTVPEPATLSFLGLGLFGLMNFKRKLRAKAK
ncbi:MAG: PEP-CTERM sorting domain-containing protein [Candidatus Omnitrophica bacterium]|nr:PEP-CTERM sorting domain-containing protein [Candidatus Omnitrophota bacterium]